MASKNDKVDQPATDAIEPTNDTRITTDFGAKQSNTNDWLRVNNDQNIGPMLLEDSFAREKVHCF